MAERLFLSLQLGRIIIILPHHAVAAMPRWEPETVMCIAWEHETVNRKGLQVTKSLEASPPLKTGGRGV
jgi:hypothetical protein